MTVALPRLRQAHRRLTLRLTLTQRLFVLALIALLPGTLVLAYNEIELRRTRLAGLHAEAARNARLAASEVEQIFDGVRGILTTIGVAQEVRSFDASACHSFLADIAARLPQLAAIVVVDAAGDLRCRSGTTATLTSYAGNSFFKEAVAGRKFAVGQYIIGTVSGRPRLPVALPVGGTDGGIERVIIASLDMAWLGARIRERGLDAGGAIAVADRDGVLIVREPNPERFVGTRIPDAYQPLVRAAQPGTEEVTSQDGTRRVLGYVPATVSPVGLYVSSSTASGNAFETIERSTWRSLAFLTAGALATLVLAWWFGRTYITHKVMRVVRTAETWRNGDLSARTLMDGRDGEIEAIAQAFDLLADELAARERDRDKADHQRELLLNELTHRVRNVLATVQSVAALSFRNAQGPDAFRAFGSRLQALARSHELLTRKQWDSAEIGEVVRDAIAPLRGDDDRRFSVSGPPVLLSSAGTVSVSMMLHELCTNAVKYGALSNETGRVSITWTAETRRDEIDFGLNWVEYGGPPVVAPTRAGFGSRLIPALAQEMGGEVQISYLPEGVSCTIRLRLAKLAGAT